MDVLPPKIAKPIGRQWPPTGTLRWDLRYSPHASSAALPSQASQVIQSPTRTLLTLAGLFAKVYKTWILRGDDANNTIDFAAFKSFWENAFQIAVFISIPASRHGYGMVAIEDNASGSLTDVVSNFSTAYADTQ
jgi:hypothetical protein